ncbi:fimbrial biogenesis outer membrane usher protein [Proteus vulgaris]|jgi:outer membrane usher protein|uniref:Fimbrial outer membrane usher protein n=5 Tax=Proteus TaxID=583 RepID=A0A379F7L5_PROVU|nr:MULTISPECIES: fimbria/pilus outer membrane usher protein [Proteus]AYY82820.1 fimbrial biogenesis outer membrane usher protein [Proteus vulgaris]MBG5972070.1 fimbrial biogenesis outer membrane usher protein [Proteus vulgaris]MBG5986068.1 fimbrial biogenesis outer membrane usher protein [Proteus vulgaris]MBI6512637.1 fimbrial biogenesis outer membrane usher protein [Proteus sp. PR00174]MCH4256779.1 fimbrial biogenesis outer membrane usher protein [Proteus vulgaris]
MKIEKDHYLNKSPLHLLMFGGLFFSFNTSADDYYPPNLLNIEGHSQQVTNEDLSVFRESSIAPGYYHIDFFINKNRIFNREVEFSLMDNAENKKNLVPLLTADEWYQAGVDIPSELIKKDEKFINISLIEHTVSTLDLNRNQYVLTLPQKYINENRRQLNEVNNWDPGIPATLVNYSFSSFNHRSNGETNDSYYGNIQSQINFDAWRFYNYSTWTRNENGKNKWNTLSNVLSRDIYSLKSELQIGDLYSSSQLFDSVKYRGLKLMTDRLMTPYQNRTYAPSVVGIANSESIITITQNGQVIYKKSVPAGPFNIIDYSPMSSGGNLYINVKESDGSEKNFIVPFSSIASLERKGEMRYSFSTGKYDSHNSGDGTYLTQAEAYYGLTDYVTLYSGLLVAEKYQSFGLGSGINFGSYGAITADWLYAKSTVNHDNSLNGNAFRVNYSKNIELTNTNVSVVGYRHFDANFLNFNDAMEYKDQEYKTNEGLKNEYTMSISQPLFSNTSSINLNSIIYKYADGKNISSYNVGFNSSINKINYSIYYTYYDGYRYNNNDKNTYDLSMNISIPLTWNENYVWANYAVSTNNNDQTLHTARLSGTYGEKNQASWDIYQGYGNKDINYSGGLNGSYKTSSAIVNAGYSYSKNRQNLNYGLSGALVATQYGAVLTPSLQQTNALILTKDTANIEVINGQSVKTNSRGLAIISGMSPYQKNNISIDTKSIPADTEISNNIISNMIPTKGALILADFDAKKGFKFLLTLETPNNSVIPMGAQADIGQTEKQWVSNFNQLYFVADKPQGDIQVSWKSEGKIYHCHAMYNTNNEISNNGLYILTAECK